MKQNLIKTIVCLVGLGAALAGPGGKAQAQVSTNLFTFDTATTGAWASWGSEWSGFYDTSEDHTANGGGSLYWYQDVSLASGVAVFNTWGGNPYSAGSPAQYIDLSAATNISFWVKWDTTYSTLGISSFNNQDYASPSGWGDWGIAVGIQIQNPAGQGTVLGNAYIPNEASNGWVKVNMPITAGSLANENQTVGLSLWKWSNTTSAQTGVFALWIDDIQAEYPGVTPVPAFTKFARAAAQGLNIYDDGNSGDRQSIETVVTGQNGLNYGWVTNGAPVTYSVNIAQAPSANFTGGQVHMMIMPGTNISESAPDWNEANVMALFIERQTNGSVVGQLRYKLNDANDNGSLFGSNTNVFGGGGSAVTNTIVAGYGGLLGAVTNAAGYLGIWSVTMTSATGITLNYPGGSSSFAFPQLSDAQAFTGPVTVYWGVQANSPGWFQGAVLSNVSIAGSVNTLNADLTQPLNADLMAISASSPNLIFKTPADAKYWLQWSPADPNYALQSSPAINGSWVNVQGQLITVTNFANSFSTSNYITSGRNYNPPPIFIGYDFGEDTAATANWVSGPAHDAGGNAGSGSVQLKWTWSGAAANEAYTLDLFGTGQNLPGGTLSFDIMIDPTSIAGTNSDYATLDVVSRDGSYNWNPVLSQSLLATAGGTTGTWAHVSIPLGTGAASTVRALTISLTNDGEINGTQTVYLDNLQLTSPSGATPTVYNINAVGSTFITTPQMPSGGGGFFRLKK